jgi:hypothetical protein
MKNTLTALFLTFILFNSFAQEATKNNYTGNWTSNASWADNSAPSNANVGNTNKNFTINGYIALGSSTNSVNLTFEGGHPGLTFTVVDTLVIFGNMTFGTDAMTLIVPANAVLIVFGNLDINNKVDLSSNGNIIVTGQMKLTGAQADVTGSGKFYSGAGTQQGDPGQGSYNNGAQSEIGNGPPDRSLNAGTDLQRDLPGIYNFVQCGGACVMPIKLSSFEASSSESIVVLKWTTTMEENFQQFIIERSFNGVDYEAIAQIAGQGRNIYDIESKYSFDDKEPLVGLSYYRLKAVDLDDSFEHFGPKAVRRDGEKNATFYPNPSSGTNINFVTNFNPSEGDRVILVNQLGVELLNVSVNEVGNNSIQFQDRIKPGTYFLKYISKDFQKTERVIVRN